MKYLFLFLMLCGLALGDIGLDRLPLWNPMAAGISADSASATAMSSADILRGGVWVAKSNTSIAKIGFYVSTYTGTGGAITGYICSVDASGNPDEGTVIQSTELATGSAGWKEITLSTPAAQTAGTTYGVFIKNTDGTPESNYPSIVAYCVKNPGHGFPYTDISANAGVAWTKFAYGPTVFPIDANGDIPFGFAPYLGTLTAIKSDTATADEYANAFTVARSTVCIGFQAAVTWAAGCNFEVNLYEGTGASAIKRTITFDGDAIVGASNHVLVAEWPAYTLTTGNTYRISIQPTTTTAGLKVGVAAFGSSAYMADILGDNCTAYLSKTVDNIDDGNGVWTDVATSYLNIVPIVTTLTTGGYVNSGTRGGFDQ